MLGSSAGGDDHDAPLRLGLRALKTPLQALLESRDEYIAWSMPGPLLWARIPETSAMHIWIAVGCLLRTRILSAAGRQNDVPRHLCSLTRGFVISAYFLKFARASAVGLDMIAVDC